MNFAAPVLGLMLCARAVLAQESKITEETPYVPSPTVVVETMLEMAGMRATDFVIDLGSGDGRIVIEAARRYGARGFGVDYDARLVKLATENAAVAGVSDRAAFVEQDIFKTELGAASVVTLYLLPDYNLALRPRLLALKPGTRVVSHDWGMGDWQADAEKTVPVPDKPVGLRKSSTIYMWVVPAQVQGRWRSILAPGRQAIEFSLEQNYQALSGTARLGKRRVPIEHATLRGASISFQIPQGKRTLRFDGQVSGSRITGQLGIGKRSYDWRALRFR